MHRYKSIQQQNIESLEALSNLRDKLLRRIHLKDHDLETARAVEIELLQKMEKMEHEIEEMKQNEEKYKR